MVTWAYGGGLAGRNESGQLSLRALKSSGMAVLVLVIGVFLISAFPARYAWAQGAPPLELKYFKKEKTIRFAIPDSLLIGNIEHMDVDPAGRMLLTDWTGGQVLLFDSTGSLQASLDPTACHPGFPFRPFSARFGGDAFIFVQNSAPWGFRFTTEGGCLGSAHEDYSAQSWFDVDPAGTLYGSFDYPDPVRILRRMSSTGETLQEFPMPQSQVPNATRRVGGGGFIADGEHLFYASAVEQDILKFSLDGTLVARISKHSSWFRFARKDLPGDIQGFMRKLGKWAEDTTHMEAFFELTGQTLLAQYINHKNEFGYQVYTKEGELVAEELGTGPFVFRHAEYGLAYRVFQPRSDGQGDGPNPILEVYRFVLP